MASQTRRTGTPASIASTALRPPSVENTWSRATVSARIEPKWSVSRDQNSCRRTSSTLARVPAGPPARGDRAYPRVMGPLSTGSPTWDVILEVGIAVCLVLTIVLLIRNYRGRR